MRLALVHFFCCEASGVRIRAQLSPSVVEHRRWSFGQRVADFNLRFSGEIHGGQQACLELGRQTRRSVGSMWIAEAGWLDDGVRFTLFRALVRLPHPPWHVFDEESRS